MKNVVRASIVAIGLVGFTSALVHPFGRIKAQRSNKPLLVGAEITAPIARILERSCQDCHSERTEWPWYSYLPPLSWIIEHDVHEARNHMDLSRWGDYTADRQVEILSRLGAEVRNHQMPLPRYVVLHPAAKLTESEVKQLYDWAHRERQRLTSAQPLPKTATD